MSSAAITFAIPFYGRLDYLDRAIRSVIAQTRHDWCVVVVDDCSPTEGARELVTAFGDSRITYVRNDRNLGVAGNWNRCVELTSSPLVTLLHSDDELETGYAGVMLTAHRDWPDAAAVFCDAEIMDAQGRRMASFRDWVKRVLAPAASAAFVLSGEEGVQRLLRGNFVVCPTLCYKRRTFEELQFLARWRFVLDLDFLVRGLFSGAAFVGIPDKAFRYRRHEEQQTAVYERDLSRFVEEMAFWRWAASASRSRGWHRAVTTAERMTMIRLQLGYYAAADLLSLNLKRAWATLKLLPQTMNRSRRTGTES